MKIQDAIRTFQQIEEQFGNIEITGGHLFDDTPLESIVVTESDGMEIWPRNPNNLDLSQVEIDGVFLSD